MSVTWLTALLVVAGAGFAFVAALGVLRLPDVFLRMHASTKAGTLGCGLSLLALALHAGEIGVAARALAGIAFLLATAPVAAHTIGRAAWRSGVRPAPGVVVDDLTDHMSGFNGVEKDRRSD